MTQPNSPVAAASAAEESHGRACRLRAMDAADLRALLSGSPTEVEPWIRSAAEQGEAWAQLRLGQMYLDGAGVPADQTQARAWFSRAAARGLAEAMNMIGRCHENGWGGPPDPGMAAAWYRRSAETGHDWGQYNYAHMLFDGRGVPADPAKAVHWYRRAADQGHARAMNLLARCLEEGWGTPQDPAAAASWYRRSAEGGYFRGQFNHAALLAAAGHIQEAAAQFAEALDSAPAEARVSLAATLARHPDPRLAALSGVTIA